MLKLPISIMCHHNHHWYHYLSTLYSSSRLEGEWTRWLKNEITLKISISGKVQKEPIILANFDTFKLIVKAFSLLLRASLLLFLVLCYKGLGISIYLFDMMRWDGRKLCTKVVRRQRDRWSGREKCVEGTSLALAWCGLLLGSTRREL